MSVHTNCEQVKNMESGLIYGTCWGGALPEVEVQARADSGDSNLKRAKGESGDRNPLQLAERGRILRRSECPGSCSAQCAGHEASPRKPLLDLLLGFLNSESPEQAGTWFNFNDPCRCLGTLAS